MPFNKIFSMQQGETCILIYYGFTCGARVKQPAVRVCHR